MPTLVNDKKTLDKLRKEREANRPEGGGFSGFTTKEQQAYDLETAEGTMFRILTAVIRW